MKTVLYVPLVNHLGRTFIAAPAPFAMPKGATPPPAAALASLQGDFESPGGTRPAILLSGTPGEGLADLVVFKRQGDPAPGVQAETSQHLTSVPYNAQGEPGTYHTEEDAEKLNRPAKATPPPLQAAELEGLTVAQLGELASRHGLTFPAGAPKKADLVGALTAAGIKAGS